MNMLGIRISLSAPLGRGALRYYPYAIANSCGYH